MIKFFAKLVLCPAKWVAKFALKLVTIVVILICLILLAGNFWIPTVMESALTSIFRFKTSVGKSSGSIFRGRLELQDLKMKNPDTLFQSKDFVAINNIVADVDMLSLRKETIVVKEVVLDIDDLTVVTSADGKNNYALLIKNFKQKDQTTKTLKTADSEKHSSKKSVLIKNLTLSISTIHSIDERKNSSREYKINYRKEFHNITDLKKLEIELVGDLGKLGVTIMIDSIISSIPIPSVATDGIIKIKDISLDTANKTKDLAGKISNNLGDGIKQILIKKDK
jgi:uncharacterized protein involved in outer membrane biogenesis